jgi:hygromycin-B 7''-O-kinase
VVRLPSDLDPVVFDRTYRLAFDTWRPAVVEVCARHDVRVEPFRPFASGSNLVAGVGGDRVVKIFPPFHRHQWESEHRVLAHLDGRVAAPVPRLVAHGERPDGWTYVVISLLPGVGLDTTWSQLARADQAQLLERIGAVMAEIHALPTDGLADLPPDWDAFLAAQVAGCRARHERQGAPAWLIAQVESFVARSLPTLPASFRPVVLTGEYTPFNLLVSPTPAGCALSGMIDFGDAMIGLPDYDLLGPCLFLAAGDRDLLAALFRGYPGALHRRRLMLLCLLHRYANLGVQLRVPGWRERARSIEDLEELIWPAG